LIEKKKNKIKKEILAEVRCMVHFSSSFGIVVAVAFQSTFHLEMY
jgi:hypothetical protein